MQMVANFTDRPLVIQTMLQPVRIDFDSMAIQAVTVQNMNNEVIGTLVQQDVLSLAFEALRTKTAPPLEQAIANREANGDPTEDRDPGDEQPAAKAKKAPKAN